MYKKKSLIRMDTCIYISVVLLGLIIFLDKKIAH